MTNALIRPSPLPQELDRGYLGRVMRINGFQTKKDTIQAMASRFNVSDQTRQDMPCIELLSLTANQSCEQFVLGHSMMPLYRALTTAGAGTVHGCLAQRSLLVVAGMRALRPGAYFCGECALADQPFHGFSYWRRHHQIPGQLWCPVHRIALRFVEDDEALLRSPIEFLDDACIAGEDLTSKWLSNSHVQRAMDIAQGLLDNPVAIDANAVANAMCSQAARLNLPLHLGTRDKSWLGQLILEAFPAGWIETNFANPAHVCKDRLFNKVDGALLLSNAPSLVWLNILAAAVLYESADEALNAWLGTTRVGNQSVVVNANHRARPSESMYSSLIALGILEWSERELHERLAAMSAFVMDGKSLTESASIGHLTDETLAAMLRLAAEPILRVLAQWTSALHVEGAANSSATNAAPA